MYYMYKFKNNYNHINIIYLNIGLVSYHFNIIKAIPKAICRYELHH